MGWKKLKTAFFVCAAIWLIGGIGVQIAIRRGSGDIVTLLNFRSIFVTGFGSVTAVLGAILLSRWIWTKSRELSANRERRLQPRTQAAQSNEDKKSPTSEKWAALAKFDDDVRAAVEKLRPYGDAWVDELRQAYFSLSEDKKYLASIVSRLMEQAEREKEERWADRFQRTFDGQVCTEESRTVLRELERQGYTIMVAENRTIAATNNAGTTYFRTNGEIQRFGEAILGRGSLPH